MGAQRKLKRQPTIGTTGKTWEVPHRQIPDEYVARIFNQIFDDISVTDIARSLSKSEGHVRNVIYRTSDGITWFKHRHREAIQRRAA